MRLSVSKLVVLLCLSLLLVNFSSADSIELRAVWPKSPDDSIVGANGATLPVFDVAPGQSLKIEAIASFTPQHFAEPKVDLIGLNSSPLNCQPAALEFRRDYGGSTGSNGKVCEVYLTTDSRRQTNANVQFNLSAETFAQSGDYELRLRAQDKGNVFSELVFVIRIKSFGSAAKEAGECQILNLNNALIIPQGNGGTFSVKTYVPYGQFKAQTLKVFLDPETTPQGVVSSKIAVPVANYNQVGLPIYANSNAPTGYFHVNIITEIGDKPSARSSCLGILYIDPVLTEIKLDPSPVQIAVKEKVPIQVIAVLSDTRSIDVTKDPDLEYTISPEGAVSLSDGFLTGLKIGSAILKVKLKDPQSASGIVKEAETTITISQPQDFYLTLEATKSVAAGDKVVIPVRLDCVSGFDHEVRDLQIKHGFGSSATVRFMDFNSSQEAKFHKCGEYHYILIETNEFTQPKSDPYPFEKPVIIEITGRGEFLLRDYGLGSGVRNGLARVIVYAHPKTYLSATSPILQNEYATSTWRSDHAISCEALGSEHVKWEGSLVPNLESSKVIGPFKSSGKTSLSLVCVGALGLTATSTAIITVENPESKKVTEAEVLKGAKITNSSCGKLSVSWPPFGTEYSYSLERSINRFGDELVAIPLVSSNSLSALDATVTEGNFYYYWLKVYLNDQVISYYLGGSGVVQCKPDLSASDIDIVRVDTLTNPFDNIPCNGLTEKVPAGFKFYAGSVVTFKLNLCNKGKLGAFLKQITLKADNFAIPKTGVNAKFSYLEGGKLVVKSLQNSELVTNTDVDVVSLQFGNLGFVPEFIDKVSTRTLEFNLTPKIPEKSTGTIFRFHIYGQILSLYGSKLNTQTLDRLDLPDQLFYPKPK